MQITIDTRHDSYATALAVLRRAYGRTGPRPGARRDPGHRDEGPSSDAHTRADEAAPRRRTDKKQTPDATGASGTARKSARSSDRGRLPAHVIASYRDAQPQSAP